MIGKTFRDTYEHVDCSLGALLGDSKLPKQMVEAKKAEHEDLTDSDCEVYEEMLSDGQKYVTWVMTGVGFYTLYKVAKAATKAVLFIHGKWKR
jgi:hypothetical protein